MTQQIDVRALAQLARLEVSDADVEKFEAELPGIKQFVDQIQSANVAQGAAVATPEHHNIFRADEMPNERGACTDKLLAAAPAQEKGFLAVKQVLSRKKAH